MVETSTEPLSNTPATSELPCHVAYWYRSAGPIESIESGEIRLEGPMTQVDAEHISEQMKKQAAQVEIFHNLPLIDCRELKQLMFDRNGERFLKGNEQGKRAIREALAEIREAEAEIRKREDLKRRYKELKRRKWRRG